MTTGTRNTATSDELPWPPDYLDITCLAHLLSTSKKQVQRMLASGRLPPSDVNISGTGGFKGRRWKRERVLAWLEAGLRR